MSQQIFDGKKPQALIEFLVRFGKKGELPAAFFSQEGEFLVSIQYLFNDCWSKHFNQSNNLLKFGANTDGWDLLINVNDDQLVIFQDELGDVDSIDITIFDLLGAKIESV